MAASGLREHVSLVSGNAEKRILWKCARCTRCISTVVHFWVYWRDADTLSGLPSTDLPKLLSARSPRPTLSPNYPLPNRISSSIPFPSPSCRSPCGAWIEAISISYIYIRSFDDRKAEKYKKSARFCLTQKWSHGKIYIDRTHLDN